MTSENSPLPVSLEAMKQRYDHAQFMWRSFLGQENVTRNTTVNPHWIGQGDAFWYVLEIEQGKVFQLVQASIGQQTTAFNHQTLAATLSKASGQKVDATDLPLSDITINLSPRQIAFTAFDKQWRYDDRTESCRAVGDHHPDWSYSPDGQYAVLTREHNLWLRDLKAGKERALTTDGERHYAYATTPTVYGRQEQVTLEVLWSPDSRQLLTLVRDSREVKSELLIRYVPTDGTVRPQITDSERRVAFPQDNSPELTRFVSIDVESGKITHSSFRPTYYFYPAYLGPFSGKRAWWHPDSRRAYYIDLELDGKTGRLVEFDTQTGKARTLIEEQSNDGFAFTPATHLKPLVHYVPNTNQLIWPSMRDGWMHLYLYDLANGRLIRRLTQGQWMVRNILHVDFERGEIFLHTAGRVAHRNPYYCDVCRVKMETAVLTTLLASDHEYTVLDQSSRVAAMGDSRAKGVSPSGDYVVATRSRANDMPVSLLFDRQGNEVMTLAHGEVFGLPPGWQMPEPFIAKGDDGKTDIYAVIWRPSEFDPSISYPVIDVSYPGATTPVGSFSNAYAGSMSMFVGAAIAELGFIAVSIETRGGGARSRDFMRYRDPRIPAANNHNHNDRIAVLKAMAKRYSYMDLERAGICSPGSVANALTAMFAYPEFFKVGVSINAISDERLFGVFAGRGQNDNPRIETYAAGLQGKLLLAHGLLDDVVSLASPLRIVNALQAADKPIDMLFLPNEGHTWSAEGMTYVWDYLVKNLLGAVPPRDALDNIAGDKCFP